MSSLCIWSLDVRMRGSNDHVFYVDLEHGNRVVEFEMNIVV